MQRRQLRRQLQRNSFKQKQLQQKLAIPTASFCFYVVLCSVVSFCYYVYMIKEIETKATIFSTESVSSLLSSLGVTFSEPISQVDRYFCNFEEDFSVWRPKANFLRIRRQGDHIFFTLKQPQSNELDVIEKTLTIVDEETLAEMVELLGYHEVVTVRKKRRQGSYKDWTICIDEVEELGCFIEVEYVGEKDADEVQKEQKEFLQKIGISEENIIVKGYDTMLYLKKRV